MATAGFTAVILPLLGVVVLERRGLNPWLKAGLTAAIFIGVLAVVINMNRGVWMAMIIVTIIYLWVKLREKSGWNVAVLILLSCSIIIITLVPPFRDRAESVWNDGVSLCRSYQLIFKDNPTDEFNKIVGSTGKWCRKEYICGTAHGVCFTNIPGMALVWDQWAKYFNPAGVISHHWLIPPQSLCTLIIIFCNYSRITLRH